MNLSDFRKIERAASTLKYARQVLERLTGETTIATIGHPLAFGGADTGFAHICIPTPLARAEVERVIVDCVAELKAVGIDDPE